MQPHDLPADQLLPAPFRARIESYIAWVIDEEKKDYSNTLTPFSVKTEEIKQEIEKRALDIHRRLSIAQKVLQTLFSNDEAKNPLLMKEFSMTSLQAALSKEAAQKKEKASFVTGMTALQTELGVPWSFMDRAFQAGKSLLEDRRFDEAADVFFFLRFLQPKVFEYWVCEATAFHELGHYEEAVAIYEGSLHFQPKNPLVFFQMASCLMRLGDETGALQGFQACLQRAEEEPRYAELYKEAKEIQSYLQQRNSP